MRQKLEPELKLAKFRNNINTVEMVSNIAQRRPRLLKLRVKAAKRKHDYRFDVPIFGERTLEVMLDSGIQTAALEVSRVVMLDKVMLLEKAAKLKIELIGYSR